MSQERDRLWEQSPLTAGDSLETGVEQPFTCTPSQQTIYTLASHNGRVQTFPTCNDARRRAKFRRTHRGLTVRLGDDSNQQESVTLGKANSRSNSRRSRSNECGFFLPSEAAKGVYQARSLTQVSPQTHQRRRSWTSPLFV